MERSASQRSAYFREWTRDPRTETLAGTVVALALIPEAIGFSIVAGVPPSTGLYGSVLIACVIAVVGGRPAMISAATASTAVLMGPIVREHGIEYLFAATILMGLLQIVAGALKLSRLMRFVSGSVLTGFANALAVLIILAQIPLLLHSPPATYGLVAVGLAIIYGFPHLTKAVPSSLVAIAVLTMVCAVFRIDVKMIADLGELPASLPDFSLPRVPLTFETLAIIAPPALTLVAVGLLETLLTARMVDDLTNTGSDKNRECVGQGVANIVSAMFGGMGGCAMIGQSIINVSAGARGRLSTLIAGAVLLVILVLFHGLLAFVPVAGLTAVMLTVGINTFSWKSMARIHKRPWEPTMVMAVTVITVVATGDLSKGVIAGVLLSCVLFAAKVSRAVCITSRLSEDGRMCEYLVKGQLFFASAEFLATAVDVTADVDLIVVNVTEAQLWDISAICAADDVIFKARQHGRVVRFVGLDPRMREQYRKRPAK
jgi:SulP family sulfate permease